MFARRFLVPVAAFALLFGGLAQRALADSSDNEFSNMSIAVFPLAADGVAPQFTQTFDAGKALTDILTTKLVNAGKLSVVDRQHTDTLFNEQKFAQSSDFQASNAVQLGHTLNANFLVVGRIVELDETQQNQVMGGVLQQFGMGGVGGTAAKVHIQVEIHVLDANTGRIIKSLSHEQAKNATGLLIGDVSTGVGGYSGQSFANSIVGQLMNETANDFADKISKIDFANATGPKAPDVTADVISMDGQNPIMDLGKLDGIKVGMFLTFFHQNVARTPTGKTITTKVQDGHGEVISVDDHSSVLRLVDGKATVGGIAKTQP